LSPLSWLSISLASSHAIDVWCVLTSDYASLQPGRATLTKPDRVQEGCELLEREAWLDLARKLDWNFSYVQPEEVYPLEVSGRPWLPSDRWRDWDEPYRTSYGEYVEAQARKQQAIYAVRDNLAGSEQRAIDRGFSSALKLHAATFTLAEFAAVIGNLRAARFGRDSAWRTMATFGALDELRHTQLPLSLLHDYVRADPQFDWTHRFYHSNNWVAIAARHLVDELMVYADPIELAVATNFVFETGFTNLQFMGLTQLTERMNMPLFRALLSSIQTDEARHAQIGSPVLAIIAAEDPAYAQRLLDKWFWRCFSLFAIVTGFAMDYLTPLAQRETSFKEFVGEWVLDQYLESIEAMGLQRPWYWEQFLTALDHYHHMVYVSAYTYRATTWFDFVMPGPDERAWLAEKYPASWPALAPVWARVEKRWAESDKGVDLQVHGSAIVGFCSLCQLVLCHGTPARNSAHAHSIDGESYMFCSEPCRVIFEQEKARYVGHHDLVKRVLHGDAPGNLMAMLTGYFGLTFETWGKDASGGDYPWLKRAPKPGAAP
jgi:toluene monooxygenase system protein A